MRSRSFSEEDTSTNGGSSAPPEYVFEGFNIEFSEKIMLSPLTPKRSESGQEPSRND